jgi:hypothetical protein
MVDIPAGNGGIELVGIVKHAIYPKHSRDVPRQHKDVAPPNMKLMFSTLGSQGTKAEEWDCGAPRNRTRVHHPERERLRNWTEAEERRSPAQRNPQEGGNKQQPTTNKRARERKKPGQSKMERKQRRW